MLPLPATAAGEEGRAVVYGFRPENVDLSDINGLPSQVGVVEPTGAITYVFSKSAGISICSAFAERLTFRPGEEIRLLPRLGAVRLFDGESGIALL
jgi:multiple sugar transport system ATP-binding protein